MSKLFKLREWLTVPEAARHLSGVLEEDVNEADVLRLALDGHLRMSMRFVNLVKVRRGTVIPLEKAKYKRMSPNVMAAFEEMASFRYKAPCKYKEPPLILCGTSLDTNLVFEHEGKFEWVNGLFDLPMIGDDRKAVEDIFQDTTGGTRVNMAWLTSTVIEDEDGALFLFDAATAEGDGWVSTGSPLPSETTLVVRTVALREFEKALSARPTAAVRDESLLAVIAALLAQWPNGKHPTGKDLEKAAQSIGIKVSDDTIRKALKAARDIAPSLSA